MRLNILVSPTWSTCLAGGHWVQTQLLTQNPSANLRVYAGWWPMLWNDSREMWNGTHMADPRVMPYWDCDRVIGQGFAKQVDGYEGIAWDSYYLYGPNARWDTVPSPLLDSGGTIYGERENPGIQIRILLEK